MSILDRYLAARLAQAWLLVLAVLAVIFGLFAFIDELDHATGNYQLAQVLHYVTLTTPQRLLDLFPVITLTGTLIAFANLARSSELVVIQSMGMPYWRQLLSAAMPALLLMLLLWPAGEFLAAPLYQHAETARQEARSGIAHRLGDRGLWSTDGERFYHIGTLDRELAAGNIDIYRFDSRGHLQSALYARDGEIVENRHWRLRDVRVKTATDAGAVKRLQTQEEATQLQPSPWSAEELASLSLSAASMSLYNLYNYLQHLKATGQDLGNLRHLYWQRAMLPVMTVAMVLLAFQLSHHALWHRDPSFGRQIGIGVIASIFFYLACQIIYSAGTLLRLDAIAVAVTPVLLILAAAMMLQRLRP